MAVYKSGALVCSKYFTPFQETSLKWIPRSKSGVPKIKITTQTGYVGEHPRGYCLAEGSKP